MPANLRSPAVRPNSLVRHLLHALALALAIAVAAPAHAGTSRLSIAFDTDNDAATGCTVSTPSGPAAGFEKLAIVDITTNTSTATVDVVSLATCTGSTFGAPVTVASGPWPVGLGHGVGHSALVEWSLPLSTFAVPSTVRAIALGYDGASGNDVAGPFTFAITAPAEPPATPPAAPIPLSPVLAIALALSILATLEFVRRRSPHLLSMAFVVVAIGAAGVVWAATVVLDGNAGDWSGVPAAVTDTTGDAPFNADLLAVYVQQDSRNLYLRVDADIRPDGPANTPPVVSAGSAQTITLPASATLSGSATDDGLPNPPAALTVAWTKVSGPGSVTFVNAAAAVTTASFSAAGTYVLQLTADDSALSTSAQVTITVNPATSGNAAPVVSAGADQTIVQPAAALLAGSATDDGLPAPPGALTLHWGLVSGPGAAVSFANDAAATTSATFGAPGTYVLRLTANDGALSGSSTVTITVQSGAPSLQAVPDRTIAVGDHLQVPLVAADYGTAGALTYALPTAPSGASLAPPPVVDWTPTSAQLGSNTFTATVTNALAQSASTTFHVTVVAPTNHPPKLAPQANQSLNAGTPFLRTLTASDPDGDPLTFTLTAKPAGMTLTGAAITWGTDTVATGDYTVTARVTDSGGLHDDATFTVSVRASAAPVAEEDTYSVDVGGTLVVPAPGVLGNDTSATGAPMTAAKITNPDKGTLTAFNADGSFTYVAPSVTPSVVSLKTTALPGGVVSDSTGYAWTADLNHDGAADVIALSFGTPIAFDGKTGERLWTGWDTSPGSPGEHCLMYLFGTDFAMGDVDDSGEITSIAGTNCDATYTAGVSTRLIAIDTNPAHAIAGHAKVKWVSERLDAKLPVSPTVGAPPELRYALNTQEGGLATSAVPTLARLTPGGAVKVLTRILIGTSQYPYDRDGDGTRETYASCAVATGDEADIGKPCSATFIVDAATGVKEAVLTAPNPDNQYQTPNWVPFRQLPPIVADLDGDGQVEIVSGGDVFRLVAGKWTLAWQAPRIPGSLTYFEPTSVMVADLDGDGKAEVIVQTEWDPDYTGRRRGFAIYDANGTLLRKFIVPTSDLSMPTVVDVDGDGVPEIMFSARGIIYAYRGDGSLLWATVMPDDDGTLEGDDPVNIRYWPQPVYDRTRAGNSVQVYDLQLDGGKEVIANGNFRIALIDGRDGLVKWSVHHNGLYANNGVPMIVDADGDGHAEIYSAAAGTGVCAGCPGTNIIPFAGEHRDWAPAPLTFNQANYNPWAIDDHGVIAYDGAVHRSFRNQRQLGTVVDARERDTATFTYTASDSGGTSAPAKVSIEIAPINHPPVITSTPPTAITYDFIPGSCATTCAYSNVVYQIAAYDPDAGDTVHYELLQPTPNPSAYPSPDIDPATGLVTMTWPRCGFYDEPCDYLFVVAAVDNHGARTQQSFVVDISAAFRTVPNVIGLDQDDAETALKAVDLIPRVTEVFDTHPAGIVIDQNPVGGAPGITRHQTVTITVSKGPAPAKMPFVVGKPIADAGALLGSLAIDFVVDPVASTTVPAGQVMTQDPGFGTLMAPGIDSATLGVSMGPPLAKPIASIVVEPGESTRLVGDKVAYTATAVFTDGTSADVTLRAAWASSVPAAASVDVTGVAKGLASGDTTVSATLSGKSGSSPLHVKSHIADGTEPVAAITAPTDDAAVYGRVDVTGTATDANFLRYELAYAPATSNDWILLREGSAPVVDGVLGSFDPTVLLNDLYTLRLRVYDRADNVTEASVTVQVAGQRKVGLFSIAIRDLTVPLGTLPIGIERVYDSRDKRSGDFGFGWHLALDTLRVRSNRVLGTGWVRNVSGPTVSLAPTSPHKVTVTLADGKVEEFDMIVSPTSNIGSLDATHVTGYAPRSGTSGSLVALGNNDVLIVNDGAADVLVDDDTLEPYSPAWYRYTTSDGTAFDISPVDGVRRVEDANGQTLTFDYDGITHSSGTRVTYTRDADHRIVAIVDPAGRTVAYRYDANGDLVTATDAAGADATYAYDRRHGMLSMVDPTGRTLTRNEYDDAGRVVAITDANGNRVTIGHDDDAQVDVITDRRGNVTRVAYDEHGNVLARQRTVTVDGTPTAADESSTYDGAGNRTSFVNADGLAQASTFDGSLPLTHVADPGGLGLTTRLTYASGTRHVADALDAGGRAFHFDYDPAGNLLGFSSPDTGASVNQLRPDGLPARITDAAGTSVVMTYDAAGRVTREDTLDNGAALLRRVDSSYDSAGNLATVTLYRTDDGITVPLVTRYAYDAAGRLTTTIDPAGGVWRTEYDAAGRMTASVDALAHRTTYSYDALGRLVRTDLPDGTHRDRAYDANGNVVAETDAAGRTTQYAYDELNRRTRTTYADGSSTEVVLSPGGQVRAAIDARGNRTDFTYDGAGRLSTTTFPAVVDGIGGTTVRPVNARTLSPSGLPLTVTDARGRVTHYDYDANGRRTRTTFADGGSIVETWDVLGRRTAITDEDGLATTFTYDGLGRLVAVAGRVGNATYAYDEAGNLVAQTDAAGRVTRYRYDVLNRGIERRYPGGGTERFSYDAVGNRTSATDGSGRVTTYTYDAMNRLARRVQADGRIDAFTYTGDGARATATDPRGTTTYGYDLRGRLATMTLPDGRSISRTRDANGNVVSLATPTATSTYAYDALNRMTEATFAEGAAALAYDLAGGIVRRTLPDGTVAEYTRDARERAIALAYRHGASTIASFATDYSAAGLRTRIVEQDGSSTHFEYDAQGRLVGEVRTGALPRTAAYAYDAVGNRVSATVDGVATAFTYDDDDRMLTAGGASYSYDGSGRMIARTGATPASYGYDGGGRLATVTTGGATSQYAYDVDGQRVAISREDASTQLIVDPASTTGLSQVLEATRGGLTTRYDFADRIVARHDAAGSSSFLHDGRGDVRALLKSGVAIDSYRYDAWGNTLDESGSTDNPHRYRGEWQDADSGLYALRARHYDPATARFLSRDPASGRAEIPISRHRYLYANDDPVNLSDPTGRETVAELSVVQAIQNMIDFESFSKYVKAACGAEATAEQIDSAINLSQVLLVMGMMSSAAIAALNQFDDGSVNFGYVTDEVPGSGIKQAAVSIKGDNGQLGLGVAFTLDNNTTLEGGVMLYPPPFKPTGQFSGNAWSRTIKQFDACGVPLGKIDLAFALSAGGTWIPGDNDGFSQFGAALNVDASLFRNTMKISWPLFKATEWGLTTKVTLFGLWDVVNYTPNYLDTKPR